MINPRIARIALFATVFSCAVPATASPSLVDKTYATAGLQGFGVGVGKSLSSMLGIRGDLNTGKLDRNLTESGTDYDARLKVQSAGVYADYFPFAGGFRLTGGLGVFGSNLSLNAQGGTADIDGQQVDLNGEFVRGKIKWPPAAPYVGIGFGHAQGERGFYFTTDLGVFLGKFKSSLDVSPGIVQELSNRVGSQQAAQLIENERENLRSAVGDLKFVPSLQLSVGYRF